MALREGQVYAVPKQTTKRRVDGWRRIVGVLNDGRHVAFVGQRSHRTHVVQRRSFLRWVQRKEAYES